MIVMPITLYVGMEAFKHHHWMLLIESPEWAIGTIFLSFHGEVLYIKYLRSSGLPLSETTIMLLSMAVVMVIASAVVNAYDDLETVTPHSLVFRLALFGLASAAFLLMVGGAKLVSTRSLENSR